MVLKIRKMTQEEIDARKSEEAARREIGRLQERRQRLLSNNSTPFEYAQNLFYLDVLSNPKRYNISENDIRRNTSHIPPVEVENFVPVVDEDHIEYRKRFLENVNYYDLERKLPLTETTNIPRDILISSQKTWEKNPKYFDPVFNSDNTIECQNKETGIYELMNPLMENNKVSLGKNNIDCKAIRDKYKDEEKQLQQYFEIYYPKYFPKESWTKFLDRLITFSIKANTLDLISIAKFDFSLRSKYFQKCICRGDEGHKHTKNVFDKINYQIGYRLSMLSKKEFNELPNLLFLYKNKASDIEHINSLMNCFFEFFETNASADALNIVSEAISYSIVELDQDVSLFQIIGGDISSIKVMATKVAMLFTEPKIEKSIRDSSHIKTIGIMCINIKVANDFKKECEYNARLLGSFKPVSGFFKQKFGDKFCDEY